MPFVSNKRLNTLQLAGNKCAAVCYNMRDILNSKEVDPDLIRQNSDEWDAAKENLFTRIQTHN